VPWRTTQIKKANSLELYRAAIADFQTKKAADMGQQFVVTDTNVTIGDTTAWMPCIDPQATFNPQFNSRTVGWGFGSIRLSTRVRAPECANFTTNFGQGLSMIDLISAEETNRAYDALKAAYEAWVARYGSLMR
jgi:hypothetical protein